jgi:pimeloyl-ACP methyl ester carboxylesterase
MRRLCPVITLAFIVSLACLAAGGESSSGTLDANGVKVRYYVHGKGEPAVLIHGWLASADLNWSLPGITRALAKDYRVIALDVRGHGRSDKPTNDDAFGPELVEDVVRLLDHLKIKQAHIVGYSMGGIIAANFLAKHPDRALTGTLGGMGWLQDGGAGQFLFAQIGKQDAKAHALAVCGRSLAKLALTEQQIQSIRVPVTVLIGNRDLNQHFGHRESGTWWTDSGSCRPVRNLAAAIFYVCYRQPRPLLVWSRERGRIPPEESHPDNVFPG